MQEDAYTPTPSRRVFIGAATAGLLAGGSVAARAALPAKGSAATPSLDAKLVRLGSELRRAWTVENEAFALSDAQPEQELLSDEAEAANGQTCEIVDQILAVRAMTLEGLLVKMDAFRWCRCNEPPDLADFESDTTDMQLVFSMLTDLHAMREG